MNKRHASDAPAVALPDDATELEAVPRITTQLSCLNRIEVGFFNRFVRDQLVPEVLTAEGSRAGAGDTAELIVLHIQCFGALDPNLGG
ncbi:hypothetical protein D9M69_497820 [compost metagenome]